MRKIVAFTSSRSDYDLLSYLYKMLSKDKSFDLRLIVSGAHLSATFGTTVKYIEDDGIRILDKIETLLDSDSDSARIKSAAFLLQNAIHSIERFSPDLILYAGDREDVIVAALIGGYLKIPTAHFFAGDHDQDGLIDNPVRHATSKLSAYKFVSLDEHRKRLLSIGENPQRIFVIGSCALDKFKCEPRMSKKELFAYLSSGKKRFDKYALVIFHPLMDHEQETLRDFKNILIALENKGMPAIVNLPNIDPGSRKLIKLMDSYKKRNDLIFVNNLARNIFVNLYRHAEFQIGNSSSGILEAASIPLAVVNVGQRMTGRRSQKNVVFVDSSVQNIEKAISTVLTKEFYDDNVWNIKNIYGDGNASCRAYKILKNLKLGNFAVFRKEDPLTFYAFNARN